MFNRKTFARHPVPMTNTVPVLSHQSWDDSLRSCFAPLAKNTEGDLSRLSDTHLTTVSKGSMDKLDCPEKSQLRQADDAASLERREMCLGEQLQSRQEVAPSTNLARQELPQSIFATHRTSSDAADHQVKGNMLSSVAHMQFRGDNGNVWTSLHVDAPAGLTAKLPTNQLENVVGHLTEFAWFECGDFSIQRHSQTLLQTLAKLVSGILSRLAKFKNRGYLAILSHINRHVVLRSGKQAQVLGISRNKVLVKNAGHMNWVEGSDIVRAVPSHPKATERGGDKLGGTVVRLSGLSDTRMNGTVNDTVQAELVSTHTERTLTKATPSKSNAANSEPSIEGLESRSESVATWRTHNAYQAEPQDGKYRCPWEGCTKNPMDSRSQYQNHIDHHLKPFRCNQKECLSIRFSSNNCLRRHIKQLHTSTVHLCPVPGCKRGTRGFPREYNLRDHLKRVHKSVKT
jgi:hypothetical protein